MLRKITILSAIALFIVLVIILAMVNSQGVPRDELMKRCQESHPQWERYQEEIKGEIGARPVAEWNGEPIAVNRNGDEVLITFQLEGPWIDYAVPLPILLRDPLGNVQCSTTAEYAGATCTYHFSRPKDEADSLLPWIEVHYPRQELRISLDSQGNWKKPDSSIGGMAATSIRRETGSPSSPHTRED